MGIKELEKERQYMSNFVIYIGHSTTIVREDLPNYGTFAPANEGCTYLPLTGIYKNLVEGETEDKTGEIVYLYVGLQWDAEMILQDVKDEELFHAEHHFRVHHKGETIQEFDGMLLDALLYITNDKEEHL